MDLGELHQDEEEEEYDSQEEKRRNSPVVLGEEATKSKRARPRSVKAKEKMPDDDVVVVENASLTTPASGKKIKTKRTPEVAKEEDPEPAVALAALALKYKDQREFFKAEGSQLHCGLCGNTFGTRSSVWKKHVKTQRHVSALAERRKVVGIAEALSKQKPPEKVEMTHRQRVAEAFFESGIELNKMRGKLKELLEESRPFRITIGDASNLARQVVGPLVVAQNEEDLRAVERGGGLGSFIFDGYSRKDEHAAVVLRTCSTDFELSERLVSCKMYQKGLTGKQWLRVVDEERRRLGSATGGFALVFSIADGHPTNGIVGENLSNALENFFHSFCISHSLAKVGTSCQAPLVNEFVTASSFVFRNSPGARAVFAAIAGEEVKRKHKVRWFTTTDVVEQAVRKAACWEQIVHQLEHDNLCEDSLPRLKKIVNENKRGYDDLWIEMSAVYDVTRMFYAATTFFEGASYLAPFVWRYIRSLRLFAEKVLNTAEAGSVMPNVAAILRSCPPHVNVRPLWGKARQSVDPGLQYFLRHFVRFEKDSKARQFRAVNDLFGFARLFNPVYAKEWIDGKEAGTPPFNLNEELAKPAVSEVLLGLGKNIKQELTADFGRFVAAIEQRVEVGRKYRPDDVLEWWKTNGSLTGSWAAAARLFSLLQPSSASVERVFSMLRAAVTEQQEKMLEDQQELRIRMRYSMKKNDVDPV
jgi:hypothetical protein